MYKSFFAILLFISTIGTSQNIINRVEPPFWWVGMKNPEVTILLHGKNLANYEPYLKDAKAELTDIIRTENPNYLFLVLKVNPDASGGMLEFVFSGDNKEFNFSYDLRKRETHYKRQGINSADAIYLITPDRFSNGNNGNDNAGELLEKVNRNLPEGRHGGDIQGIINKLDYIKSMGYTAIWSMPFLENNMQSYSYHGYSITDLYNIDARFGGNEKFLEYVEIAHSKGLKIIKDLVFNQVGSNHYWTNDLPAPDWFHKWDTYTNSSLNSSVLPDPHASEYDYNVMLKGWFDRMMPDMNQSNRLLASYLIQHTIFWVEYASLDGIRMDTYQYNYKDFLNDWLRQIYAEYPDLYIVGEVWYHEPEIISYWKEGFNYADGYKSELKSITDFPIQYGIEKVFGSGENINLIYDIIARDFLYKDPSSNMVFADNHDVTRLFTRVGEDINKFKQAMTIVLTTRGIPQVYYGTEILMTGTKHQVLRADYPGGWEGDSTDAFTPEGRSPLQNEAFNFITKLLNQRKQMDVLQTGKLVHFQPYSGMYVYFRILHDKAVMVAINTNEDKVKIDIKRHAEILEKFNTGTEIMTGEKFDNFDSMFVHPGGVKIVELFEKYFHD